MRLSTSAARSSAGVVRRPAPVGAELAARSRLTSSAVSARELAGRVGGFLRGPGRTVLGLMGSVVGAAFALRHSSLASVSICCGCRRVLCT